MPKLPLNIAAALAGATLLAAPVSAQYYDRDDDDDDIGAGEVIAGAAILGGLAAILSDDDDDDYDRDDYYYDRRYDGQYYRGQNRADYTRELIERCVNVAENEARRWGPANVTQIEDVDRDGRYLRVEGDIRIAGNYDRRGWRDYDYDNGEEGEFECTIDRRGRVTDIDFDGL